MYKTPSEVRAAFWSAHPNLSRKRIKDYSGKGLMYQTDTRCAFTDFVDALCRDGLITQRLAERVTLSRD